MALYVLWKGKEMRFCYEYSSKYIWAIISLAGFNPVIYTHTVISSSVFGIYVGILGLEFGVDFHWKGNGDEI